LYFSSTIRKFADLLWKTIAKTELLIYLEKTISLSHEMYYDACQRCRRAPSYQTFIYLLLHHNVAIHLHRFSLLQAYQLHASDVAACNLSHDDNHENKSEFQ
jgi:predicted cupin superfamily sugar epimerase